MINSTSIGTFLIAVASIGLIIEFIWAEIAMPRDAEGKMFGKLSLGMKLLFLGMRLPMMLGLFLITERFGWHWIIRAVVGVLAGEILCFIVYNVFGAILGSTIVGIWLSKRKPRKLSQVELLQLMGEFRKIQRFRAMSLFLTKHKELLTEQIDPLFKALIELSRLKGDQEGMRWFEVEHARLKRCREVGIVQGLAEMREE